MPEPAPLDIESARMVRDSLRAEVDRFDHAILMAELGEVDHEAWWGVWKDLIFECNVILKDAATHRSEARWANTQEQLRIARELSAKVVADHRESS